MQLCSHKASPVAGGAKAQHSLVLLQASASSHYCHGKEQVFMAAFVLSVSGVVDSTPVCVCGAGVWQSCVRATSG
jgi:hypothetical protein